MRAPTSHAHTRRSPSSIGLDDLGRALPYTTPEQEPNLAQVAGEIRDEPSGLVQAVLDDLDDN